MPDSVWSKITLNTCVVAGRGAGQCWKLAYVVSRALTATPTQPVFIVVLFHTEACGKDFMMAVYLPSIDWSFILFVESYLELR